MSLTGRGTWRVEGRDISSDVSSLRMKFLVTCLSQPLTDLQCVVSVPRGFKLQKWTLVRTRGDGDGSLKEVVGLPVPLVGRGDWLQVLASLR